MALTDPEKRLLWDALSKDKEELEANATSRTDLATRYSRSLGIPPGKLNRHSMQSALKVVGIEIQRPSKALSGPYSKIYGIVEETQSDLGIAFEKILCLASQVKFMYEKALEKSQSEGGSTPGELIDRMNEMQGAFPDVFTPSGTEEAS